MSEAPDRKWCVRYRASREVLYSGLSEDAARALAKELKRYREDETYRGGSVEAVSVNEEETL